MTKRSAIHTKRAVRAALAAKGRNQVWLAKRVRISNAYLSRILNGEMAPAAAVLDRIQTATGVDLRLTSDQEASHAS